MKKHIHNQCKMKNIMETRQYPKKIHDEDIIDFELDLFTVEEWNKAVDLGCFGTYDGSGYWMKDGFQSMDEVFSTPQLDATHVIWYNK